MSTVSLNARYAGLAKSSIIDAALALLETQPLEPLSIRAVARGAGISERTIFRHFATRDILLDAVAEETLRRLQAPPLPDTATDLLSYPGEIYARFEAREAQIKATLRSELYDRIRTKDAEDRRISLRRLIDRLAPDRTVQERTIAAANIHYHVIATTWHYYRFHFGFSPRQAVACATAVVRQALLGLDVSVDQR